MSTPSNPLPIQYTPFTADHFKTPEGIAFVNQQLQQIVNGVNAGNGAAGRVTLPNGLDVRGATISGLGAPKNETDAISSGHATTQFSAQAQQPQLDIGGKYALKGLTGVYLNLNKVQSALPTTYTGGGVINLFGFVIQLGFIATMDTAVFPMNFPAPFPNACQALVAFTTGPNDRITYAPVLPTATQFTLANNGSGAGAFWIAAGW